MAEKPFIVKHGLLVREGANDGITLTEDASGINSIKIKCAGTGGVLTDLTLPNADGGVGEFLQNNGSGTLSWAAGGGGGSMDKFWAAGDSGSAQDIFDSDTLNLMGGTGIETVGGGGGANTVQVILSDTAVTPGSYANPALAVNQQGQITSIINGANIVHDWLQTYDWLALNATRNNAGTEYSHQTFFLSTPGTIGEDVAAPTAIGQNVWVFREKARDGGGGDIGWNSFLYAPLIIPKDPNVDYPQHVQVTTIWSAGESDGSDHINVMHRLAETTTGKAYTIGSCPHTVSTPGPHATEDDWLQTWGTDVGTTFQEFDRDIPPAAGVLFSFESAPVALSVSPNDPLSVVNLTIARLCGAGMKNSYTGDIFLHGARITWIW